MSREAGQQEDRARTGSRRFIFCPGKISPSSRGHRADGSRRAVQALRGYFDLSSSCRVRVGSTHKLPEAALWAGRRPAYDAHHVCRHLLPLLNSKSIADGGIAMQAAWQKRRGNYCKGVGYLIEDCTILKEEECLYETNQDANQHAPRRGTGGGRARKGGLGK